MGLSIVVQADVKAGRILAEFVIVKKDVAQGRGLTCPVAYISLGQTGGEFV